jgi:hypothetical protein
VCAFQKVPSGSRPWFERSCWGRRGELDRRLLLSQSCRDVLVEFLRASSVWFDPNRALDRAIDSGRAGNQARLTPSSWLGSSPHDVMQSRVSRVSGGLVRLVRSESCPRSGDRFWSCRLQSGSTFSVDLLGSIPKDVTESGLAVVASVIFNFNSGASGSSPLPFRLPHGSKLLRALKPKLFLGSRRARPLFTPCGAGRGARPPRRTTTATRR